MKRYVIILLVFVTSLACTSCHVTINADKLKVADPAERIALRNRSDQCRQGTPLFQAAKSSCHDLVRSIRPAALFTDFRLAADSVQSDKLFARVKDFYSYLKDSHADGYSPWATLYFLVSMLAIVAVLLTQIIRLMLNR